MCHRSVALPASTAALAPVISCQAPQLSAVRPPALSDLSQLQRRRLPPVLPPDPCLATTSLGLHLSPPPRVTADRITAQQLNGCCRRSLPPLTHAHCCHRLIEAHVPHGHRAPLKCAGASSFQHSGALALTALSGFSAQVRWRFQARVRPSSASASCRKPCSSCVAERAASRALMDAACFCARNCSDRHRGSCQDETIKTTQVRWQDVANT